MIHRPVVGEHCSGPPDHPVVHTHGSIALMLRGSGVMHMGSAWTVQQGDVFLVPEGAPHYRLDHEQTDYVGVGVCMSCLPTNSWGAALRALFAAVAEGACPVLRISEADRAEVAHTLRSLHDDDAGAPWLIQARLGVLTALLRRATPAAAARPQDSPLVARALDHIARHALEPLSLVDVARAVGRAPSYLATLVKTETGESVGAWIAHARMAQARELLLRGDDTIDVVADKVGYGSASHFHRTFRRMHGLSPAAWRAEHRQGRPLSDTARGTDGGHGGHGVVHGGHRQHHHAFSNPEAVAQRLESPERDAWQRPDEVLRVMKLAPSMVVADVGAGTGYFAARLAQAVPSGKVIATDVAPAMVTYLRARAANDGWANLEVTLASNADCGLSPASVDRALVVHVWHHHPDPSALARSLSAALKPDGRLFVVEFAPEAERGPPTELRVAPEQIIAVLEAEGLRARVCEVDAPDQVVVEAYRE